MRMVFQLQCVRSWFVLLLTCCCASDKWTICTTCRSCSCFFFAKVESSNSYAAVSCSCHRAFVIIALLLSVRCHHSLYYRLWCAPYTFLFNSSSWSFLVYRRIENDCQIRNCVCIDPSQERDKWWSVTCSHCKIFDIHRVKETNIKADQKMEKRKKSNSLSTTTYYLLDVLCARVLVLPFVGPCFVCCKGGVISYICTTRKIRFFFLSSFRCVSPIHVHLFASLSSLLLQLLAYCRYYVAVAVERMKVSLMCRRFSMMMAVLRHCVTYIEYWSRAIDGDMPFNNQIFNTFFVPHLLLLLLSPDKMFSRRLLPAASAGEISRFHIQIYFLFAWNHSKWRR